MTPVFGQMIIKARDISVPVQLDRPFETVAEEVKAVADRIIVGQRIPVENGDRRRVYSNPGRIQSFDLRRVECFNSGDRLIVHFTTEVVFDDSVAEVSGRNDAHDTVLAAVAAPLVVYKEEEAILHDRAAERAAEYVANQFLTRYP